MIFSDDSEEEVEYAQVHRVHKRVKIDDLYLLQLFPSSELSSECVPLSDTVQPICLDQSRFQVSSTCVFFKDRFIKMQSWASLINLFLSRFIVSIFCLV